MSRHLDQLMKRHPDLEPCRESIAQAFEELCDAWEHGGKVLLCGNGGSAADADHWAGELLKGFHLPRPLTGDIAKRLGDELAETLQEALPAVPLGAFNALATAFGNDVDPNYVFAQLVMALGRLGDVLVCLSTSGRSRNVLLAARTARALGMKTVALTGGDGGDLARIADVAIVAPAQQVDRIQEYHLPIYHTLSEMIEERFFGD